MTKTTTITISEETWEELNRRKRLGESFDDVIRKLLKGEKDEGGHEA